MIRLSSDAAGLRGGYLLAWLRRTALGFKRTEGVRWQVT